MKVKFVVLASFIALTVGASAQLNWEKRTLEFKPDLGTEHLDARFKFKNVSNSSVTIVEVKPSCGCTTTALSKKTYEPGEEGEISANFHVGEMTGIQEKHIIVKTDAAEDPMTQLTIKADIPKLLEIIPNSVSWNKGAQGASETVYVSPAEGVSIKVLGVDSSDERILPKLKALNGGKKYEVLVSLNNTDEAMKGFVRLDVEYGGEKPKVYKIPVTIQ